jgi:hypothetical protein
MYHYAQDRLVPAKEPPDPSNVPGPFYVTKQCITCGLPPETAPANINFATPVPECGYSNNCRFFKQPENEDELEQVIQAMLGSCVSALRYRGTDQLVLKRLESLKLEFLCDANK